MKTKQMICVWSVFCKHGLILLILAMQVNVGYVIIENENRVTGKSKIPQECKNGNFWATGDTYAVAGRPSKLVSALLLISHFLLLLFP
jgi:hypothetical protein